MIYLQGGGKKIFFRPSGDIFYYPPLSKILKPPLEISMVYDKNIRKSEFLAKTQFLS